MTFQLLTRPFLALLRFIMHNDDPQMRVFSKATDSTNASLLLASLSENLPFLKDGLGNILVTKVDYCKCRRSKGSPWEHEFLLVTLKESNGAKRTAGLLVDRLMDGTEEYEGGPKELLDDISSYQGEIVGMETTPSTGPNSIPESEPISLPPVQQWATSNPLHRSGAKFKRISKGDPPNALDRLVILPNLHRNTVAKELGNSLYDVLMTMDLTQSQNRRPLTLERFAHLLRTTSRNTPLYHYIFAQCYWYAYTIWKILEIETQPRTSWESDELAKRQCTYSGYGQKVMLGKGISVSMVRSPETIKAQWEAEKPAEDERWAKKKRAIDEDVRREAEGRRQAEAALHETQGALQESQAEVHELRRELEHFKHNTHSPSAV